MYRYYLWVLVGVTVLIPGSVEADAPVTTVYCAAAPAPRQECPPPVTVVRRMGDGDERFEGALLDCERHPRPEALRALSVLARPRGLEAPAPDASADEPGFVAEGVRELHPGLLDRLQRLSEAFEGRPIEILSGYRPAAARTSRHHHARALDLRVEGVEREAVRDVVAGFERTGVGWYPRSVFVHVDVREAQTYWVDESGPGERPRYVAGATPPAVSRAEVETATAAARAPTPEPPTETPDPLRGLDEALGRIRITLPE